MEVLEPTKQTVPSDSSGESGTNVNDEACRQQIREGLLSTKINLLKHLKRDNFKVFTFRPKLDAIFFLYSRRTWDLES